MKKTTLSLAILALAMGLNSCSNDNENEATAPTYITISAEIGGTTRLDTNANGTQSFVNGDQISVYAWTGSNKQVDMGNLVVDNSINTYNGYSWKSDPQMLWKNSSDLHYFIALYPKTETSVSDLENFDYTLDTSNQEKSDLLVATHMSGMQSEDGRVPLTFSHVMAKIDIHLTLRDQWGEKRVDGVFLRNASSEAKVNCLTKEVRASNATSLALPAVTEGEEYSSVVIPQSGVQSVIVIINGMEYTYNHNADIPLESGKTTTIYLNVGRDQLLLSDVNIKSWEPGTEINGGEAQE